MSFGRTSNVDEWWIDDSRERDPRFRPFKPAGGVWSNRSQAAKRRWADPVYRATLLKKRRENAAPKKAQTTGLAIGPLDSVVFSPSAAQSEIWRSKADEINKWARSNQLRREARLRWNKDPMNATYALLESGAELRSRFDNETYKLLRQQKRRDKALSGWETRRRNAQLRKRPQNETRTAPQPQGATNQRGGTAARTDTRTASRSRGGTDQRDGAAARNETQTTPQSQGGTDQRGGGAARKRRSPSPPAEGKNARG
jgi:hypothetical protein